ncbi:MAG: HD domain-containing protein [Candidatus Hodarchaeota archaeon]
MSSLIVKAFEFAYNAHKGSTRKSSNVPYIAHPLDVAAILMKNQSAEDVVIAAFLHDVVEDEGVRLTEIEELFGKSIRNLVKGVSEPEELRVGDKKKTWKKRKQHTINQIKTAEKKIKLLSCADKLSNIQDMINDSERLGEGFWNRFNASKKDQKWYYESLCDAYRKGESIIDFPMYNQYRMKIKQLFKEDNVKK